MNRAIVITRYAGALVRFVRENGQGDPVCQEAEALLKALQTVPDLARMVEAAPDVVSGEEKKNLLQTALGAPLSPEMDRFLSLLIRNGRMELVPDILRDFVSLYRRSIGVRKAHLTAVAPPSDHLLQSLKALVKSKTGDDVVIEVDVDPALVGGFVLDLDAYLLDASIKRQLDLIREQFIERNRRII